jgi:hypothetical protein
MKPIRFVLLVIPAVLLMGACEDEYDYTKECGREGNCCWFDNTCNPGTGLVCDTKTKKCVKAKDSGPPADSKPTPDTKPTVDSAGDMTKSDATSDAKPADAKPTDTKPTPDTAVPDMAAADSSVD